MVELTVEQVQAFQEPHAAPSRIVNPQTRETFVLLPVAEYERLTSEDECQDVPSTDEERDLLRMEACALLDTFGDKV